MCKHLHTSGVLKNDKSVLFACKVSDSWQSCKPTKQTINRKSVRNLPRIDSRQWKFQATNIEYVGTQFNSGRWISLHCAVVSRMERIATRWFLANFGRIFDQRWNGTLYEWCGQQPGIGNMHRQTDELVSMSGKSFTPTLVVQWVLKLELCCFRSV